jgi:enoyl-ACP reductase-like protein
LPTFVIAPSSAQVTQAEQADPKLPKGALDGVLIVKAYSHKSTPPMWRAMGGVGKGRKGWNQGKLLAGRTRQCTIKPESGASTAILDVVAKRAPLRRNTDPAEVADAAVFLASDLARGVTGNILYVDSGMQIMG